MLSGGLDRGRSPLHRHPLHRMTMHSEEYMPEVQAARRIASIPATSMPVRLPETYPLELLREGS